MKRSAFSSRRPHGKSINPSYASVCWHGMGQTSAPLPRRALSVIFSKEAAFFVSLFRKKLFHQWSPSYEPVRLACWLYPTLIVRDGLAAEQQSRLCFFFQIFLFGPTLCPPPLARLLVPHLFFAFCRRFLHLQDFPRFCQWFRRHPPNRLGPHFVYLPVLNASFPFRCLIPSVGKSPGWAGSLSNRVVV